eukprot:Lankesteria_metandrocarpae@DN5316_c3_g2_i6.p1
MLKAVVPAIRQGGIRRVLVMPNLRSPVYTCEQAAAYRDKLMSVDSEVEYLMTLYLDGTRNSIDDLVNNARSSGVQGVKCYPRGVTTNSDFGVESLDACYPLFTAMEKLNLSLHIHGEVPGESPLVAEQLFLPQLHDLCRRFPALKVVLEHVSSAAAVDAVKSLDTCGATITAHHMHITKEDVLTVDPWHVFCSSNYCKPLAKDLADRNALRQVVVDGHRKFFLGSDSAPHPASAKSTVPPAAGVFTSPYLLAYVGDILQHKGALSRLVEFASVNGHEFFGLPPPGSGVLWSRSVG